MLLRIWSAKRHGSAMPLLGAVRAYAGNLPRSPIRPADLGTVERQHPRTCPPRSSVRSSFSRSPFASGWRKGHHADSWGDRPASRTSPRGVLAYTMHKRHGRQGSCLRRNTISRAKEGVTQVKVSSKHHIPVPAAIRRAIRSRRSAGSDARFGKASTCRSTSTRKETRRRRCPSLAAASIADRERNITEQSAQGSSPKSDRQPAARRAHSRSFRACRGISFGYVFRDIS